MRKEIRISFYAFLMLLLQSSVVYSQQNLMNQTNQLRLGGGIFRIAEQGQLADSVNVWGDVQNSGRFLIPVGTTIANMISYAGGPVLFRTGDTVIDWSVVKLEITVSRSKTDNTQSQKKFLFAYSEKVPEEFKSFELENGDIVIIQVKRKRNWRDYLQVIGPIASTVTAVITTYVLLKNL
ncbi:hypothetical protein EP331_00775 [bacterium]|nr:MAG: hypothetical protein EP331_00775 [bacterium]